MEGKIGVPDEGLGLSGIGGELSGGTTQNVFRLLSSGNTTALVEQKQVKGADSENLGVPVVDGDAVGFGELGCRKAFHAGSGESSVFDASSFRGRITYASARHFNEFRP